jgi:DNA invertase Pin-like site-specific DNA recombinase
MPSKASARAYSYLRFSTPEQAKGDSLRRQTALADAYAKRHGLTLDTELNLRDLGVSAFRGDNVAVGALGGFLKAIRDGLIPQGSSLLVEALDRVSRQQARKAVRVLEEIVEAGVTVVTLNDGKAYTEESLNGTDFLMAILLFMRGAEESETKARRLRAAWENKRDRAARGEVQTTRVPAWLQTEGSAAIGARNAKLAPIPDRVKLIRRMFKMFLDGQGKHAIAEAFNAEKIPTWGDGKGRAPAKHWHRSYVLKILLNPAVTGVFTPHIEEHRDGRLRRIAQKPIADYYPRIIDNETFERVQTLIRARARTVGSRNVASIVAGLARCPECGSTMTRVMKGSDPKQGRPKLVCTKAKASAGCNYRAVPLADVEHALVEGAVLLRTPPLVDNALDEQIDVADEELYRLGKQIEALVNAIERTPSAALSKRLAEREAQATKMRAELSQLRERATESESRIVALRARRLAEALTKKPLVVAVANAALRECVESAVVDYRAGLLRLKWRHGPTTELLFDAGFGNLDKAERKRQRAQRKTGGTR